MINVLVADDHPIVRRGIKQALSETDDITVAGETGNSSEVMRKLKERQFDVVLLDISMPGGGGIEVLKQLRGAGIKAPVLILSIFPEEQYAMRSLRAGASGYVMKSCEAEVLVDAIRKVARGGKWVSEVIEEKLIEDMGEDAAKPLHERLSDREYEVLRWIASGKSVSEIAKEMTLSMKTVSTYRARIRQKMHMKNNSDFTRYAIKNKLIN
jgi:two-component system invasion response regulator UvrY